MKFGQAQSRKFNTLKGAYSLVTSREYYDSQITLTDYEAYLVLSYFGTDNIHVGNVTSNPVNASKSFKLFPEGNLINLNLVFPKPHKSELRLYLSERAGFKPQAGDVWFIFINDEGLWLGALSELAWRLESSELKQDDFDDIYQANVNQEFDLRTTTLKERDVYKRDRNVALQRLKESGYICEFDNTHQLFVSRFSKKPYIEIHHLIPMSLQGQFTAPLDRVENVFCLCPYCHRAVHHAEANLASKIIDQLASQREVLGHYSIDKKDLLSYYALEDID